MSERRDYPRVTAPLAASVFEGDQKLGDYVVQNISEGGALLVHGPQLAEGCQVRIVLRGPEADCLPVNGVALRLQPSFEGEPSIAIKFNEIGPRLRDFIQAAICAASKSRENPSVLIVHRSPTFLASVAMDLAALGYHSIFALRRFELVRCLHDPAQPIQAVVMELTDDAAYATEVFDFVRGRFPDVLRIAASKDAGTVARAKSLGGVSAQAVIGDPPTRRELEEALRFQPNEPAPKVERYWSDAPKTWPGTFSTRSAAVLDSGGGAGG